jgi:outer membrane protein OmpA-like peptidoglycan-associated protein
VRIGVLVGLAFVPLVSHAEPRAESTRAATKPTERDARLEATAFVGIGFLGSNVQLGDSWAPEQVPGNAPLFGFRLTFLAAPTLVDLGVGRRFQFGIELEAELATANTRSSMEREGRMTYFAPVFGWRGHVMFRYVDATVPLRPHLVFGAGGATVASESPYMRKESDPLAYYGGGFSMPLTRTWQVRIDARHGVMAARGGGITNMAELQFGIGGSFDVPEKRTIPRPPPPLPEQPEVDETDGDHDGLPDRIDRCPAERETVNGLLDGDGCPEPDADNDTIIGDADKCPDAAEDKDGFEDEDGCPETDNDNDGLLDAADKCPIDAETRNGFDDEDGCPDTIPPEVTKLLATASGLRFEGNRARVTDAAQKALRPILELMLQRKNLRVAITGRPAKAKDADLAKRRAEAVKWFLIDQGIGEGRFETRVAEPGKGTAVELTLILE